MFNNLSDKIISTIKRISGQGRLTERNIEEALREIRLALLEADVNFKVAKIFLDEVKSKALGSEILRSVTAGQQFTKIVYDELVKLLGGSSVELNVKGHPAIIMMVGLQGSGKTTSSGKLALYSRKKFSKKPGLVPVDVMRPAAIEQLKFIGQQLNIPVFDTQPMMRPQDIVQASLSWAQMQMIEVLILDTAGRLQIDESLMNELCQLKEITKPQEILLVADAMLGQESVHVAQGFHARLNLTGLILTKIDGDARGGAALSIRQSTGIPIKFFGTGEKMSEFEVFYPERLASRILDMGDIVTLVEKAQEVVDEKEAKTTAKKILKKQFTMEDFLGQLQMMKKLGGIGSLLKMLPGASQALKRLDDMTLPDKELKKIEAIINSMTPQERQNHKILNGSRRKRIALGSGTQVSDVNRFVAQFEQTQKMMSNFMKMGMGRGKGGFPF